MSSSTPLAVAAPRTLPSSLPSSSSSSSPSSTSPITYTPLTFSATPLTEYAVPTPHYAAILDNVFSPAECASLVRRAEESAPWEPALVNIGGGRQTMMKHVRSCDRIIWDCEEVADEIYSRIRPWLEEVARLDLGEGEGEGEGSDGKEQGKVEVGKVKDGWSKSICRPEKRFRGPWVYEMTRLNERLRVLKYKQGNYFKPHFDGCYFYPPQNPTEYSFLTVHLYLNDPSTSTSTTSSSTSPPPLPPLVSGGATRFWSPLGNTESEEARYVDVKAKAGRVLVFQQFGLRHSGEEVGEGTKLSLRTDVMFRKVRKEEVVGTRKVFELKKEREERECTVC